jgi:NitT/TauT family transport system substrate-binding protein
MKMKVSILLLVVMMASHAWADLKVGLMPAYNSIPLVVADRKGLFAAEGVRVELVPFSSQLNRETALQAGSIDGTVSDMINAIQSWSHGFGAKVTSVTEGSFSLLSSPQSSLRKVSDWQERGADKVRTGLLENSIVYYVTERMLQSDGTDTSLIELVPILQLPARLEMLLAGKIEAACLPEPLATIAAARGAHRISDTDAMGTTPGVLLFSGRALSSKQREIASFYRAYDKAVTETNANGEAYRDAIVAECEFPPAVTGLMKIPRFRRSFVPAVSQVEDVARWMKEKGLVTSVPRYDEVVLRGFASSDAGTP